MTTTADEIAALLDDDQGEHEHWTSTAAQRDIVQILAMAAEAQMEALRLYEPTPKQEIYHQCRAKELVFSKGNQFGGSLMGFAENARAVLGMDPHNKYPKKNGICVCLGYGEKHIGNVIHKYLFRPGAFEIIRDKETGLWRTYRPWEPGQCMMGKFGDLDRADEARPAPPLIPPRYVSNISMKRAGLRVFDIAYITTGWEIYAYNSQGEASHAMGFQCDLWHIDEDVATDGWVSEAIGRLSKRKGLMRWTAMPHAKTEDIVLMIQRAEEEQHKPNPSTVVIYAGIDENPYLSDETKEQNKRIWKTMGEEEYSRRVHGRLILGGLRMYPTFNERLHSAQQKLSQEELTAEAAGREFRHKVQKILTERQGEPPDDWCRYLSIDPGITTAGIFLAVPPPELGDWIVAYKELYIPNCTASIFATTFRKQWKGEVFQEFIFDFHGGRLRSLGSGEIPSEVWESEFAKQGLTCVARGSRLRPGDDDIKHRELCVREALLVRHKGSESGYPKLLIDMDACPALVSELKNFRRKVVHVGGRDIPTEDGNRRVNTHAVEALEQVVGYGCPYVRPPAPKQLTPTARSRIMGLIEYVRSLQPSSGVGDEGIVLGARSPET